MNRFILIVLEIAVVALYIAVQNVGLLVSLDIFAAVPMYALYLFTVALFLSSAFCFQQQRLLAIIGFAIVAGIVATWLLPVPLSSR